MQFLRQTAICIFTHLLWSNILPVIYCAHSQTHTLRTAFLTGLALNVFPTEINQENSTDVISIVLVGWLFFFFKGKQWDKAIICPANRDFYQSLQLIRSGWLAATGVTKIALCSVDMMRTEFKWVPLQIQLHLCSTLIMAPIDWKWQKKGKKSQLSVITRVQSNTHFEKKSLRRD